MGKYTNAVVGFPVFSLSDGKVNVEGREAVAAVGGGGSARSGVKNSVTLFSVVHEGDQGIPTVKEEIVFDTGSRLATSVDVSFDDKYLAASVSERCMVLALDTKAKTAREVCFWETDELLDMDKSPCQNVVRFTPHDSSILATGGDDKVVRVWRLKSRDGAADSTKEKSEEGHDDKSEEKGVELRKSSEQEDDDEQVQEQEQEREGEEEGSTEEPETDAPKAEVKSPNTAESHTTKETETGEEDSEGEEKEKPVEMELQPKLLMKFSGHVEEIKDLAFSPSGNVLASISGDKSCRLWNMKDGKLLQLLPSDVAAGLTLRRLCFIDEDHLVILQARPGRGSISFLVEFRREKQAPVGNQWTLTRSCLVHKSLATTIKVHGDFISVGDAAGGVTLVDARALKPVKHFPSVHGLPVTGLSSVKNTTASGKDYIVTASMDKTMAMVPASRPILAGFERYALAIILVVLVLVFRFVFLVAEDDDARSDGVKEL